MIMIKVGHIESILKNAKGLYGSVSRKNALSSYVVLIWLSLISILAIPIYIRILGLEAWGLVAACTSLQILSNLIDSGFSQILPKWAAQEASNPARLKQFATQMRNLYIGLGLFILVILQASAEYLSHQWFRVAPDHMVSLEVAIRIVSFQFFFQFINNFHIGFWNGLQLQVLANVRLLAFGTLKHITAFLFLLKIAPEPWAYTLAFASIACWEVCQNGLSVNRQLGKTILTRDAETLTIRPLLKEVYLLSIGTIVGVLVSQIDRVILGRLLDSTSYGVYTVVASLAVAMLQLQAPMTRAYFPIIVGDLQIKGLVVISHLRSMIVGTILACTLPCLLFTVFAPQILRLWLNDSTAVEIGSMPLRFLLIAVAINSIYGCIYQLIIAYGLSKLVIVFNLLSLLTVVSVAIVFGQHMGILLGGVIWMANATAQLLFGVIWLYSFSRNTSMFCKS